ncbi:RagB/SusD family nutrient uptake outer membrane protein [Pedobacter sp. P26]|uniref:RagB/SusD family nutrient uptake outer membrane protein n=1 Tax=Pedobacter sp. P26 TaxID=3423956 RepID=UPI003D67CB41
MKYLHISLCLLLICSLFTITGCKKFLAIDSPTSSVNPVAIKDFQEMLNSDSLGRVQYFLLDAMSDDIQLTDVQTSSLTTYYRRAYFYENAIWNATDVDRIYNGTYARIFQMNIILDRINSAAPDPLNTPQNKSNIISQALIHRAYFYLQLVNAYGKAYDATTSSSDLAVPLVLVPDATALLPRATIEQVYAQIIKDLKMAVDNPYLASKGSDIIHPGKAAAFALLARAYLYKGDYANAEIYADSTLSRVKTLTNYTSANYLAPTQFQDLTNNPETLMGKLTSDEAFFCFIKRHSGSIQD